MSVRIAVAGDMALAAGIGDAARRGTGLHALATRTAPTCACCIRMTDGDDGA